MSSNLVSPGKDMKTVVRLVITISLTLNSWVSHAQADSTHMFKTPAHIDPRKVLWRDSIYLFSDFEDGRIIFSTGFSPDDILKFNYNMYLLGMDFINSKGDTVPMKPLPEIKMVRIGSHFFYYDQSKGFIQLLFQNTVSLGVVNFFSTEKMEYSPDASASRRTNNPGVGTHPAAVIPSYDKMDHRNIASVYDRYYAIRQTFYFIDHQKKIYKSSVPHLYKVFPGMGKQIRKYMADHSPDMEKREDLLQMLAYLNTITSDQP